MRKPQVKSLKVVVSYLLMISILVSTLIAFSITSNAGTNNSLSGTILPDFTFEAGAAAQLKSGFKAELVGTTYSATTDVNGKFEINGVPAMSTPVKLKISKANYLSREINIPEINANLTVSQTVDMWAGDIAADSAVNMSDIMEVAKSFNITSGNPGFLDYCDINKDNSVNMQDIMIVARHFNAIPANYPVISIIQNSQTPTATSTATPTPTSTPASPIGSYQNLALGKTTTASSTILGTVSLVTDGDKTSANYIGVTENLQWLQIDFGSTCSVDKINVWHYFEDGRTYHDVIARLSNDSSFTSGVTTVFNNDTDNSAGLGAGTAAEYAESSAGKSITFSPVNARYVRLYTNGSSNNIYNHYVEVEAWGYNGTTISSTPTPTATPTSINTPTPTPTGGTTKTRVVGYIPSWNFSCYQTADMNTLTHMNIAFANPDASGNLSTSLSDYDINACVTRAHQNGVKVLISLGGGNTSSNFSTLMTAVNREAFCDKILQFVNKYNLDGVDVDIEGSYVNSNWGPFVDTLYSKLSPNNKLLTAAVAMWLGGNYSTTALAKMDFVNIMAYDQYMGNGPVGTYQYAVDNMNYFCNTLGVQKSKAVLGVPFYGYDASGAGYTYRDIIARYPDAWNVDTYGGINYNGAATIASKTQLGKTYGGVMIWEISQDAVGDRSLLKVISNNIK